MKTKKTNRFDNTLLLIDGENLLHRSFHKFKGLQAKGVPTGAIYGFLKSLHSNIYRFNPSHVIVTFDNGRSKFRTKILPTYKGSRTKLGMDYDSLQYQKKALRRILKLLMVPVVFDKSFIHNYESDDFIALLSNLYKGNVLILSSDKDFCQLIDKRVKVISPSKENIISVHNCKEIMGYEAHECVDYLTLTGDTSDNIPGAKGIGPAKARLFLDNHKSIQNYIDRDPDGINKVIQEAHWLGKELIDLNYFIQKHPLKLTELPIKYGKTINTKRLMIIFDRYQMNSLQSNEFINIYKNLKQWQITK